MINNNVKQAQSQHCYLQKVQSDRLEIIFHYGEIDAVDKEIQSIQKSIAFKLWRKQILMK